MIKETIIGLLALVLLLVPAACDKSTEAPVTEPELSPPPQHPLNVEATPSQAAYLPGELVEIEFSFTNAISELITVSPFPPEIRIMPPIPDKVIRLFQAGTDHLELKSGETATYGLTWDQRDNGGQQVSPGWYYFDVEEITITKATEPRRAGMSTGTVAKILIQFPQGAMEKTIEVNQSQTVNGLTITLERVELSLTEVKFYASTIPPDYSPPEIQGSDTPPDKLPYLGPMYPVHATYTFDGITKDAGWAGLGAQDDGIRLNWAHPYVPLDPIPSDARELIFAITRFGDWEGPWEFTVSLD